MRRKDREVTDKDAIEEIISRCTCCRIGFNDNGEVYIVPLNFGYETGEKYTFYFHGAKDGRKINLIKSCNEVGFEMDTNYLLKEADIACGYSARFQSIIGNGVVSFVENPDEKINALQKIMKHTTGKGDWTFDEKMLQAVMVFKLEVIKISCKNHA